MSEQNKSVEDIYEAGLEEVRRIMSSFDSTPDQRKAAEETLNDLTATSIAKTLETVEERTAALDKLIAGLSQIAEKVKANPPYLDTMKNLTSLSETAQKLLTKEKEGLV